MNKGFNCSIFALGISFIAILYFLPDIVFTNNLSSQRVYHKTLKLKQDESIEDLLISSKSIKTNSDSSTLDLKMEETQHAELKLLLKDLGLSTNLIVIKNSAVKVVSSSIYWQVDFFNDKGYGNILLENQTNKILKFNYFFENAIKNLNSEDLITEYFKYLNLPLQQITKKDSGEFQAKLSEKKNVECFIDNYRILLNISDTNF
ncbi:hypothetical protein [Lactococcus lactis]|uniref:hypothetical protein n=1 Tax=Lactococcus lactis TaxID=1358 RepID=UPI001D188D40|nr:hypothetical protein [Lactococcus lactis]MCC4121465.1 hypothetical protein [Lactococcus lactis]